MPRLLLWLFLLSLPSCLSAQSSAEVARLRLRELGNEELRAGSVSLLKSPQEKYDTLFNSVRGAKRYIHVEYFWIADDSVGGQFVGLLAEKAREGVEVRMIIDGFANHKSDNSWTASKIDSLTALGIHTVLFDPLRFPWINHCYHRDHRKIVIIDGESLVTGGMNIADYYLTGTARSGQWRDMHLKMEGEVAGCYERVFERMWQKVAGESLDSLRYGANLALPGDYVVSVVNREPLALSKNMRKAYTACIDAAESEVRILNPYPTNVRMVRKAIYRALRRGVRVMVMASASNDVRTTPDIIAVEMKKLVRHGCEVYYYEGGFHHSKVMTVDGEFCTVGTANLDGRSMLYDYEINAFIFDRGVTRQLNAIFDEDLTNSEMLTLREFKKRFSLMHRVTGRVLTPIKGLF